MSTYADQLSFYRLAQSLPPRRSISARILVICFVGTHVPLIAGVLYALTSAEGGLAGHLPILGVLLAATLIGTGATLYLVHELLAPVRIAARALRTYTQERVVPDLPLDGSDEAGELLASTRAVCERLVLLS